MKNRLEEFRIRNGWTQQELADRVEVSRQTIISLVLGGGNMSLVLAPCAEHFKRLGSACRKCRAIYAQPH